MFEAAAIHAPAAIAHDDALARLRLIRTPSIGPVSFRQLLARFGTAATAGTRPPSPTLPPRSAS